MSARHPGSRLRSDGSAPRGRGCDDRDLGKVSLLGMVVAVFTLVALVSSLVVPLRQTWSRVAVRVAGSWIAAIGLLLLGWAARPAA